MLDGIVILFHKKIEYVHTKQHGLNKRQCNK